jgi:hypothetical protein
MPAWLIVGNKTRSRRFCATGWEETKEGAALWLKGVRSVNGSDSVSGFGLKDKRSRSPWKPFTGFDSLHGSDSFHPLHGSDPLHLTPSTDLTPSIVFLCQVTTRTRYLD